MASDPYSDAVVKAAAKAIFFCQHNIMHDHEMNWRRSQQWLWRECAEAALKAADAKRRGEKE